MKLERQLWRSGVLAMLVFGGWVVGCGAQSPEVPEGDDDDDTGGMGGTFPTGGAGPTGGNFPTGGSFPTGGAAPTGGSFPTGGASTGGSFPTGGSGGSSTECGQTAATAADTAIDNLEDGDNTISMPRKGYWYTYNDMTGCTQTPAPDPSGLTPFVPSPMQGNAGSIGARTNGSGCTKWGAGIGVDLNNCNMKSNAYNASVFNGITFWYKSTTAVRFMVGSLQNVPDSAGGGCTDADEGMCFNHHGYVLQAAPAGMVMNIPFSMLMQEYGTIRTFDKAQIINIQFQASNMVTTGGFDIVVDDLSFAP